jgi:hypothetical protein
MFNRRSKSEQADQESQQRQAILRRVAEEDATYAAELRERLRQGRARGQRRAGHIANLALFVTVAVIAEDADYKALLALDARWLVLQKQIGEHTDENAKGFLLAKRAEYQGNPSDEKLAELRDLELSKDRLKDRFKSIRREIKEALRGVAAEALPHRQSIFNCLARLIGQEIATLTAFEQATAAKYGVPFEPSQVIGALENLLERYLSAGCATAGNRPTSGFEFLKS